MLYKFYHIFMVHIATYSMSRNKKNFLTIPQNKLAVYSIAIHHSALAKLFFHPDSKNKQINTLLLGVCSLRINIM